jgi:hypothetical protein
MTVRKVIDRPIKVPPGIDPAWLRESGDSARRLGKILAGLHHPVGVIVFTDQEGAGRFLENGKGIDTSLRPF